MVTTSAIERKIGGSKIVMVGISLAVSMLVMLGWVFGIKEVLSIIPGASTMKFNTALLFFFTVINLIIFKNKNPFFLGLFLLLNTFTLILALLTLIQYLGPFSFNIDNLFVMDVYSENDPGRMSPATALSFMLTSIGFFGFNSKKRIVYGISELFLIIVTLTSLIAIISYVLNIPSESKAFFLQTMAINTSTLFLGIAIVMQLEMSSSELHKMFMGKLTGSRLFIKFLPLLLLLPVALSFIFLYALNKGIFTTAFGITLYTVVLILLGIVYTFIQAKGLNEADVERLNLENALKRSNQRLHQFKDGLDQVAIVAITDVKGVITYVNQKFSDISKYSKQELLGKTHAIINSGHHPKEFFKNLWKTIGNGGIWVGEVKNRAKDGSYYWVHTAIVPFKDKSGRIIEYMAIRQDITQQKMAEELLHSDYVKKLEYKNKELEQFVYIASHDLQEPLRTITSFTTLLNQNYGEGFDETGQKSMRFITEAANRMSLLIKDLLDYSRIGQNRKLELVDCNSLLNEVKNDLDDNIKRTKATVNIDPLPEVKGYETELRLLFQNLISNAIKFQKPKTKPVIQVSAEPKNDGWLFSVKDNGIGIKSEHLEKIFVLFKRLQNRNEYEGTGIGLAHCQKIVEMHGGEIWAESQPEQGSTFYFTLKN